MSKHIKSVAVLVAICGAIALMLAGVNTITAPIIEKNAAAAANQALLEVMPEGTGFETMDISGMTLPATVTEAHKETSGLGYVIKLVTKGYGADMVIMCGVTADGKVSGAVCLSSNETLSKEKTYGEVFAGKDAAGVEATDTISGATMTTGAYKSAVQDALNTAIILGGGSVDIRTPEQILADNLTAALPAGEGKFQKVFIAEKITGVDAIYAADNGQGYVAVIGEEFIPADATGASDNAAVAAAVSAVKATTYTDVDLSKYPDINANVTSVKKTATGNYVLEVNGLGFGYFGDDHAYQPAKNIPIVIRVAVAADGTILDCLTVSHQESDGYGAKWGEEAYYGQFVGKNQETYNTVDTVAGATISNNGYLKAIERCLQAVAILEGGAK